jgi:cobalt-precorrin 5A hydrolase / precorrin-3B C17-methyltransferase
MIEPNNEAAATELQVYPIYLTQLTNVLAVVVGGGQVAERKINGLLAAGGRVRLISPQATPQLQTWAAAGQIEWIVRSYQNGDLAGAFLVFAATNQRQTNAEVAMAAAGLGVLCNVVDAPAEGNFHVPAVHRQAGFTIAVGSGGQSPKRAKQMRDQIAAIVTQVQTHLTAQE